ncbi:MAG: hypothetical protein KatS3mg026_1480 [Bacteroidia bacterium]|nr:MAG: hypothetical protein KatS3mg026_1480 [Bacteroidia bacterium]
MRRVLLGLIVLGIVGLGSVWVYRNFLRSPRKPFLWQNLPEGYSVVVYTPSFAQTWKKLRSSPLWSIWAESPHLSSPFQQARVWDSLLSRYPFLADWVASRGVLLALYPEGPLYLVEAPFLAKYGDWRGTMAELARQYGWPVHLVQQDGYALWKLPDGYLAPAGEILVFSPEAKLVVRFLRGEAVSTPPWEWTEEDTPTWLFMGWQGPELEKAFQHPATAFLRTLRWGELRLYLEEEGLVAQGLWQADSGFWNYLSPASLGLAELCPPSTEAVIALHLQAPTTLYRQYLRPLYEQEITQAEKWLGLSFEEDFFAHLSGEVGLVQAQQPFILLRLKDAEAFQKSWQKLQRRVRHRTPFRWERENYRGYEIASLEVKGLFRWLFGRLFSQWESPYFARVGDWVAFARDPSVLKVWIDAHVERHSLYERAEFAEAFPSSPRGALTLGYFHLANPTWLRPWLDPAQYARWQKELAPWSQATFILRAREGQTLDCSVELRWRSSTPAENLPTTPALAKPTIELPSDTTAYDSLAEEYYPNGVLKRRATLLNGLLEGDYTEYHPNGIVKVQGTYEQGQKVGKWRYYNTRGELLREENWGGEETPMDTAGGS